MGHGTELVDTKMMLPIEEVMLIYRVLFLVNTMNLNKSSLVEEYYTPKVMSTTSRNRIFIDH